MNRRNVLLASGVTLSIALAGCASDSDENGDANENENGDENGDEESANGDENGDENGSEDDNEEEAEPSILIISAKLKANRAEPGESVPVDVDVENSGGADGEVDLEVMANWELVAESTETVAADSEERITVTFSLEDAGEYDIAVNDRAAGVLTVEDPSPKSYTYEGSGAEVITGVDLENGLTVVEGTHDGTENFKVQFYGEDDDEYGTLYFNEGGEYEGASAELLDASEYMIDVEADGNWTLEVRQPRPTVADVDDLPQTLEGDIPDVIGPIAFEGRHTAYGKHDGDSNFQVQVYPEYGHSGGIVFNEVGEYEGETMFSQTSVGWVDVEADGNWTVEME